MLAFNCKDLELAIAQSRKKIGAKRVHEFQQSLNRGERLEVVKPSNKKEHSESSLLGLFDAIRESCLLGDMFSSFS